MASDCARDLTFVERYTRGRGLLIGDVHVLDHIMSLRESTAAV